VARAASALLGIGYFVWMPVANGGQTVGKMAAGIAVMRMDGSPLTYLVCLGRWAGYLVSTLLAGLGFVAAAFTDKKRALHDYLAGTRVVYIQEVGAARKAMVVILGLFLPILAITGILAAVAIPKFSNLSKISAEGQTKANLGLIRSSLSIYYGDMEGQYPADVTALTVGGKYMAEIPAAKTPGFHPDSSVVHVYDASVCTGSNVDPAKVPDAGGWGYVMDPKSLCNGSIFVNCTHTDTKQKKWAAY
jgi:hypothetical protein